MVSTRIERATRDLHFAPSLPPHPDPLEWVAYGSLSKRLLVGSAESLSPDIPAALETALRFAQHLILHPSGLAHAATFIACTTMPDALVKKAIRRVLATRQWTIALDSEIKAGNAMHFGPSKMYTGPLLEELHLWYGLESAERLSRALETDTWYMVHRTPPVLQRARELLLAAVALAGAMVHALRYQVKCELIRYPEIYIPLDYKHDYYAAEISSHSENRLLGGIFRRGWDHRPPALAEITKRGQCIGLLGTMSLDSSGRPHFETAIDVAKVQALNPTEPMDFLTLELKHRPREKYRIDDAWIMEIVQLYESGQINEVNFPVEYDPTPLKVRYTLTQPRSTWQTPTCSNCAPQFGLRPRVYTSLDSVQPPPPET